MNIKVIRNDVIILLMFLVFQVNTPENCYLAISNLKQVLLSFYYITAFKKSHFIFKNFTSGVQK